MCVLSFIFSSYRKNAILPLNWREEIGINVTSKEEIRRWHAERGDHGAKRGEEIGIGIGIGIDIGVSVA
ncbi:hypothetical protein TIFTF001_010494 [Ficus carica]|uniref:Uncharacterized protein n=1 Tax=Ficus carica TaxID=3494 RepID=A0AA88ACB1_FICCA|nr:hypothetical protein TIFTF001_010494 [Ficus carica]